MDKQESDIILSLSDTSFENQRLLAENTGYSLGGVNRTLKALVLDGYLDDGMRLTDKSVRSIADRSPKNAVILAAGYGMRMVPINTETPKALLKVNGECLIERQIKQLHEVGIEKIYVVVGFMKERFEYLIDDFGVELITNPEYSCKNNLYSLLRAVKYIGNSYIIPCDIWCAENPFKKKELYSWYMLGDLLDESSEVRLNRKGEVVRVPSSVKGNHMVGIAYITEGDAHALKDNLLTLSSSPQNDGMFWEEALYCKRNKQEKMTVYGRAVTSSKVVEINTYEQLRMLDANSKQLRSKSIRAISEALGVDDTEIVNITVLKKGMTNRSFLFECRGEKYIMRVPGEGTDKLINRAEEADVYGAIRDRGICDNIVYINPKNGYKITEYLHGARVCDPFDGTDVAKCMARLRAFHELSLEVGHEFDIFKLIDFYESLWGGEPSMYSDYKTTKEKVLSLKSYIDEHAGKKVLTHIDAVPDNFLFVEDRDGNEDIRLIDWEYAGMQDPHVDVAMFCIYSMYDREQVDRLIDMYFVEGCPDGTRTKIYCYIAACGLLWSNWCEYKYHLGVEFGDYSLKQYRYAKDYYKIAKKRMEERS